jgi:hypothetical protein
MIAIRSLATGAGQTIRLLVSLRDVISRSQGPTLAAEAINDRRQIAATTADSGIAPFFGPEWPRTLPSGHRARDLATVHSSGREFGVAASQINRGSRPTAHSKL